MTTINLSTATQQEVEAFVKDAMSFELLEVFNAQSGNPPVNRFASRAVAVDRFTRLAAELRGEPMAPAPTPTTPEPTVTTTKQQKEPKAPRIKKEPTPKVPADPESTKAKRAESITNSWKDPAVAAKRAERHAVRVDGHEYRSMMAAFQALGLPTSKLVKFRMRLKAEGKLTEFGREWVAIEA